MLNIETCKSKALPAELDERNLDAAVAAGTNHTGGRFMLDVAGHDIGLTAPQLPPGGQGQASNNQGIIAILIGL